MSKKNIIVLISLIVVLSLLIGAYFFVRNMQPLAEKNEEESTIPQSVFIISVTSDDITQIYKKTDEFEFTLVKGETWTVLGSDTIKLNQSSVDSFVYDVANITASEVIAEDESYLTPYGLTEPSGVVAVTVKSGEKYTLNIGNKTPMQNSYYVNTAENPKTVYILYSSKVDNLLASVDKLRDKTIVSITEEEITFFKITRKEGVDISMKRKSEEEIESQRNSLNNGQFISEWEMQSPYKRDASLDYFNDILFKLSSLAVRDFIDNNPGDLAKYGLDKPGYIIEYGNNEGKNVKLLIGKSQEGYSYAQLYPNSAVFTIDNNNITFKDVNPIYLVNRLAYLVNIETIAKVTVNHQGGQYVLESQSIGENEYAFKINGKEASDSKFKKVYQDIIGLTIEDKVEGVATGPAEVSVEYAYNNGKNADKIELISISERYYAISINGKVEYSVEKKNVTLMLERLKELDEQPR